MGCRIIEGKEDGGEGSDCAVFYDSVTGTAFGPLMESVNEAVAFSEWLESHPHDYEGRPESDPRVYPDAILAKLFAEFRNDKPKDSPCPP